MLKICCFALKISLYCHFCFLCKLLYQRVGITKYFNHRIILVIYQQLRKLLYYILNSYILTILTPWLYEKNYEIEQMNTVTTGHIDLCKKNVQWESICVWQHFTLQWKQNLFVMHTNHYMHFTVLCCRYLYFTASCRA